MNVKTTLPSQEAMEEVLDKPDNGLLIVELSQIEAKQLRGWLHLITMGELIDAPEHVGAALHKVYKALAPVMMLPEVKS